ncbi:MAG: TonB-dependent receptor [Acidobacteria bacterium]|nr:TonB-dependent receptor [Acidobacteriota bacterium]
MRFCSAFLALLFLASIAFAQNTTFRGQVIDELGAVIQSAEIKLIGQDGRERTARSNSNGEFSILNVPPGIYTLTSAFKGFQTHVEEDVKVPLANSPFKIIMTVAVVNEAVETKAEGSGVSVEPDQNMTATILGEDFIRNLPDNEDDLRDFLQALAGPAAGGATGGQGGAQILVDGFSGGRLPPREAIQQIRINQTPFSAEYDNPGFARIEIITRPGLGEWRGGGGFGYRNSALDARNAFALEKPDFSMNRYNFNFGGPIIRKKMSFFLFGERNDTSGSNTTVATTLDGQVVSNVPTSSQGYSFGLRTDYLLSNKNTLNVNYNYSTRESLNNEFGFRFGGGFGGGGGGGGGGNSYLLPERGSDSNSSDHNLRIGETWIISSRLINEARMQYSRERSNVVARTQGRTINVLDSFSGGGSSCCPNESRNDEVEIQNYLTYTHKKHTIKGGVQFTHENIRDLSGNNFNGTYTFSNLAEYRIAVESVGTPLARAQQFTINRGDPYVLYKRYTAGFFLQDDFRFNQRLTLSFGLREEFQSQLTDRNNWSPRLAIAWSPFKNRKTTIRGGAGLFYSRLSGGSYENTLRFDGETQESLIIRNALYPDPFFGNPTIEIRNTRKYILDPDLKAPYTVNFNVALEQQLPRGLIGTLSYIHTRGIHQFRLRNINAPFPGTDLRPNPDEGNLYQIESTARSVHNGLNFGISRRFSQRLSFFTNYSLSWTNSDADGANSLPANNYDLRPEWGRAFTDRRHFFSTVFNLTLPRGFRVNSIINASAGAPFNIRTGNDENRDFEINDRPAGINRNSDLPASLYRLLPDRLICPPGTTPSGRVGSICNPGGVPLIQLRDFLAQKYPDGVTALGPGQFNVNMFLSKTFGFGKRNGQTAQLGQGGRGGQRGGGGGGGGGQRGGGGGGPRGGGGGGGGPRGGGPGGGGGMMIVGGPGGGPGGGTFIGGGGGEAARLNITFTVGVTNLFNRVNFRQYGATLGSTYFGLPSSSNPARQLDFNVRFNF